MTEASRLEAFLAAHESVAEARLSRVRGSSPRDAGAVIYVAPDAVFGTIGGGQLEYMAIDEARAMLARGDATGFMDVPLGPEIGQCCGGRVEIGLRRLNAADKADVVAKETLEESAYPHVYLFGAGHVGRALAQCLALLPVKTIVVDTRPEELALCAAPVETRLSAVPESVVRAAPPHSAFVILTHDHSLDFLLTAEVLDRGDAAYVGMIGSATKRAQFRNWREGSVDALICPIGAGGGPDKRPQVIAAHVAAEVIAKLATTESEKSTEMNQGEIGERNELSD